MGGETGAEMSEIIVRDIHTEGMKAMANAIAIWRGDDGY